MTGCDPGAVFLPAPPFSDRFLAAILGIIPAMRPARLSGSCLIEGASAVPVLRFIQGTSVSGHMFHLDAEGNRRLGQFMSLFQSVPMQVTVETDTGLVDATAFVQASEGTPGSQIAGGVTWDARKDAILCRAAAEIMALDPSHSLDALRARWNMALGHAASVQRAEEAQSPAAQRRNWTRDDVERVDQAYPYAWFFGVREENLNFRRFDGSLAPRVRRAGFVMSDAVTVLPYDPARDRVLVVEQFRYGPWLRGAANCWTLEAIAGRVDPFETPQDCALREAQEEARITLHPDRLLAVGNVYPSPGAVTEYLYQFVALCDLPDGSDGIAGLDSEAEDIRSHVIPFSRLMQLIESGEVENGPLVLTAYFLATRRAQLRAHAAG